VVVEGAHDNVAGPSPSCPARGLVLYLDRQMAHGEYIGNPHWGYLVVGVWTANEREVQIQACDVASGIDEVHEVQSGLDDCWNHCLIQQEQMWMAEQKMVKLMDVQDFGGL